MKKNCIVAQSGGPTSAINASLAGIINGVLHNPSYDKLYGAIHGIQGVFKKEFLDLTTLKDESYNAIDHLSMSPAMYLGSCRYKMPELYLEEGKTINRDNLPIYEQIFATFEEMNIGAFFYIGGNDSMDTVAKLSAYAKLVNSEVKIAGIPKTIDNDLEITDHTPGFGSAAKYVATSMLEIAHDTYIYDLPSVTIVEIMGRDAGWLTASAALARNKYNKTPQLIYLPEVPFDKDQFLIDVKREIEESKNVVVAVSEGIRDASGEYISSGTSPNDKFGHARLSGAGRILEYLVKDNIDVKVRSIELNILQRCAGHILSATDIRESEEIGEATVNYTANGYTGFMTSLTRKSQYPYITEIGMADVSLVANKAKAVPVEWIADTHNDVKPEIVEYIQPLIRGEVSVSYRDGLPSYLEVPHLSYKKN